MIYKTLAELVASLRAKIEALQIKEKLKVKLLKKVERLEKRIQKQKQTKASLTVMHIEQKVTKKGEKGKISNADVEELLELLDEIERAP